MITKKQLLNGFQLLSNNKDVKLYLTFNFTKNMFQVVKLKESINSRTDIYFKSLIESLKYFRTLKRELNLKTTVIV